MSTTEKQVTVSGILKMLDEGKTRDVIATELGLTKAQIRAVFQHPSLKGKKVRINHLAGIQIVDDIPTTEAAPVKEPKTPKAAKVAPESATSVAEEAASEAAPEAEQLPDTVATPVETKSPWDR